MTTTDDLITRLAAEPPAQTMRSNRMVLIIVASIVAPVVVFLFTLGTRPNLALAWTNPMVPFKTALPLATCLLAMSVLLRLARPEARVGQAALGFIALAVVALTLWTATFAMRPPETRFAEVGAFSLSECLGLIVALAIIPTIATLRVLRQGASTSPTLSGALAGLTAASGVAVGYSMFCTRDNPLFFVTWYGVAILFVTLVSAVVGRRVLNW
ncbi:MAG: DUF1109 domain-containing protein [Paracoccaceae bacterium]